MSFVTTSPKDIPEMLREAYRLARERRSESARILRKVVLTLSPLLLLILAGLLALAFLPPRTGPATRLFHDYSIGLMIAALAIVAVLLAYIAWMFYYISRCVEEATKLALASVDGDESIREVRRGWAMVRLALLLAIPIAIVQGLLRSAGLGAVEVRVIVTLLFSILFLSFPAIIESGSAVEALRKAWLLVGTHTVFMFCCGLIATVPSVVTPLVRDLLLPSSGRTIVAFATLIFSLWFDFQYAPFFIALVYRTVSPKGAGAAESGGIPDAAIELS